MINNHLELLRSQLDEYFSGRRRVFTVPLAPTGTPFQKQVWDKLLEIPFGESRSYKEQADRFGNAAAIRAIASANGKNPIAILIPCHRILGHDGSLTGYAGGLHRKQWLLDHERKYSGQAIQGRLFD